ncbi:MAG: hypothetical protein Alpg2KO_22540 [Alphaproteobacteria bacterium]
MAGLAYTRSNLVPGEQIFHVGKFNWTYTASAFINVISFGALAGGVMVGRDYLPADNEYLDMIIPYLPLVAAVIASLGILKFLWALLIRSTTEMVITTGRLIFKQGIVARNVTEMNLENIEGAEVNQSVFGRIFGYGTVMIRGTGEGDVFLPSDLDDPAVFRMKIREARTVMMEQQRNPGAA